MIIIDRTVCTGCKICQSVCGYNGIDIAGNIAEVNENCNLCGACYNICPVEAISVPGTKTHSANVTDYGGIWVFVEQSEGKVHPVVFELLSKSYELASKIRFCNKRSSSATEVCAVLIGHNMDGVAKELVKSFADKVYLVDDRMLRIFNSESYTYVLTYLINKYKPAILLGGSTSVGRCLFPSVAVRLRTGLTADCTELDIKEGLLVQTRPAFGGNVMATILCEKTFPQMATVRYKAIGLGAGGNATYRTVVCGKVINETVGSFSSRTKVVNFIKVVLQEADIQSAEIIVAGGRGIGRRENFKLIEELASILCAGVGASRPLVDEGWVHYSHQVGQTGKTVKPKLYIACGISGAIQHLAGMSGSGRIIAINRDPDAPIFQHADLGVVGNLFEVIPQIIQQLKLNV